jgi:predicted RNase H-like nuclease (RuvC/YqgF family)
MSIKPEISDAIKNIVREYGEPILQNRKRLGAMLADYLPDVLKKDREAALKEALSDNVDFFSPSSTEDSKIEQRTAAIVEQAVQQCVDAGFVTGKQVNSSLRRIKEAIEKEFSERIQHLERENKILQEKLSKKTEDETFNQKITIVGKNMNYLKNEIEKCKAQVTPLRADIDSINKK